MNKFFQRIIIILALICLSTSCVAQVRLAAGFGHYSNQEYNTDVTQCIDAAIRCHGYDWVYENIYANQIKARQSGSWYPYIYLDVYNDGTVEVHRIERLKKYMNDELLNEVEDICKYMMENRDTVYILTNHYPSDAHEAVFWVNYDNYEAYCDLNEMRSGKIRLTTVCLDYYSSYILINDMLTTDDRDKRIEMLKDFVESREKNKKYPEFNSLDFGFDNSAFMLDENGQKELKRKADLYLDMIKKQREKARVADLEIREPAEFENVNPGMAF